MGLKWVPSSQQHDVLAGVGLPREQHRWDMVYNDPMKPCL